MQSSVKYICIRTATSPTSTISIYSESSQPRLMYPSGFCSMHFAIWNMIIKFVEYKNHPFAIHVYAIHNGRIWKCIVSSLCSRRKYSWKFESKNWDPTTNFPEVFHNDLVFVLFTDYYSNSIFLPLTKLCTKSHMQMPVSCIRCTCAPHPATLPCGVHRVTTAI